MITKDTAVEAGNVGYYIFYHKAARNGDGTAVRCRVNGKCKTWKTRPEDFRLPVKHGFKECFYITPANAHEWMTLDPTCRNTMAAVVGLAPNTPLYITKDKLIEEGFTELAECITPASR